MEAQANKNRNKKLRMSVGIQTQNEEHRERMKWMQRAKSYPEELLRDSLTNSCISGIPRIFIHRTPPQTVHEEENEENESELITELNALDYVKFTLRASRNTDNNNNNKRMKSCGQLQSALVVMAIRDNDSIQLWRLLSRRDVDINETDGAGMKPIHYACLFGSLEMLKILIQNKADIDATTSIGDSCLDIAVQEGNFEVAQYLIMKGATIKNVVNGIEQRSPSPTFENNITSHKSKMEKYKNSNIKRRLSKEI